VSRLLKIFGKKNLTYASVGSVVIKFSSASFTFINSILLARLLSLEGFGYYILAFSTVMLLAVPTTLGIPFLITRYVSKYEVHHNYAAIKGLLIKTNLFVLITSITVFAVAAITYFFWWGNFDQELVDTLKYALLLVPVLGFGALRNAALRGMKLVILAELPDSLLRNALFTICLLVFFVGNYSLTPHIAMLFQVLAGLIGFIIGYLFFRRSLLSKLRNLKPVFYTRDWMKQSIPFSINSGVNVIKSKFLIYMLAIFGSIEAVAIFEVAMRAAALVSFILDALNMAISPFISSAFEKKEIWVIQKIVKRTSRIIFFFSFPVAMVFIFGGSPILNWIFGANYNGAYIPLLILCIAQLINAMVGSVGLVLNMTGHQVILSRSNIMALLITILLSIPLIINYDSIGAALIFGFVLIAQNMFLLYHVRKLVKVNTTIF
jgi:O-antigen/teichoic acid export membrane protein